MCGGITEQAQIDASEDDGLISVNEAASVYLGQAVQLKIEPLPKEAVNEVANMHRLIEGGGHGVCC